MSNEWSPPSQPEAVPPSPVGPPSAPPGSGPEPVQVELEAAGAGPEQARGTSPKRKVAAGVATAVALTGASVFAVTRIADDDDPQGAGTAAELGELTLDAFEQTDVLGAMDLLLPSERETYGEPLIELIDELERLEILSDVDLSDVNGVDVTLTDRDVSVEETNVDDIVHINLTAEASASVVGDELPTGPILEENDIRGEDNATEQPEPLELPLVGIERDGRWYLSMMYTVAEVARLDASDPDTGEPPAIPAEGITPRGADSPEGALDLLAEAAEERDVEAIIAGINPREAEALQRYAPLFLDDAEEAIDDVESTIEFTELDTRVEGDGDRRQVLIENLGVKVESQGEAVEILWADGCLVVEANGDSVDFCKLEETTSVDTDEILDDFYAELEDPEPVERFVEALTEAFAEYEEPGISVAEVDGAWYVSPVATGTDHLLALFAAVDADEVRQLIDLGEQAADALGDGMNVDLGD